MQKFSEFKYLINWLKSIKSAVKDLQINSQNCQKNDVFIAYPGKNDDGRNYLSQVLDRKNEKVKFCLIEETGHQKFLQNLSSKNIERIVTFKDLKHNLPFIANNFYETPSQNLKVIAITGTNGKTSTAWWLAQSQLDCGMIGTLGIGRPTYALAKTGLTTPSSIDLQKIFNDFYFGQNLKTVAIEASSIGLFERRLLGTQVHTAVFTNLTQDHLDFHGNMNSYWKAKQSLFNFPNLKNAVINIDSPHGVLLNTILAKRKNIEIWTTSISKPARIIAKNIVYIKKGITFNIVEGRETFKFKTQIFGEYNVSNLIQVIASLRTLGLSLEEAVNSCSKLKPAPGRLFKVDEVGQSLIIVDYAHTPDALKKTLVTLRKVAETRNGKLWCIFGCGGNRDKTKRPLMGEIAQKLADKVVITSDNPRDEDPRAIIQDIISGINSNNKINYSREIDRRMAIDKTIQQADFKDIILIAGKGHETYQEIKGQKRHFSDIEEAENSLKKYK